MNKVLYTSLVVLVTAWSVFFMANTYHDNLMAERGVSEIGEPVVQEVIAREVVNQENAQIDAIDRVSDAIVGVVNIAQDISQGEGSGVVYAVRDGDTYIVTNEHVVAGGNYFEVVFADGERMEAELVGSDIYTDLAVLRLVGHEAGTVAKFGNTEDLRIGQTVIAIGNPLGLNFAGSATSGIVSGHDRTVSVTLGASNEQWEMTVLQTDTAINPGNSGGALINLDGEVVGINSMKIASGSVEGMSFSIPTYVVLPIIEDLETQGAVLRPTLGVSIIDLTSIPERFKRMLNIPENQTTGIYVDEVTANSLADSMGLQSGDVIIKIGDTVVHDRLAFRKELFNYREGDEFSITVLRESEEVKLTTIIVLAPR